MEIKAEQKFVKMTPRKLRLVADMVRKMEVNQALSILPHLNRRGASPVLKVIKTAVANAVQAGISETNLKLKSIQVAQGPKLKRFRPVSKGRAHGYERKMSHIRVVLTEKAKPAEIKKKEVKTESKKDLKIKK